MIIPADQSSSREEEGINMKKIVASILMSCAFYALHGMQERLMNSVLVPSLDRAGERICIQKNDKDEYEKIVTRETDDGQEQVISREPFVGTCETFLDNWERQRRKEGIDLVFSN
jgi:hypothetical protein